MIPRLLLVSALALVSLPVLAAQPAQVMLFGTFHIRDAGLDVAKNRDIDIFTEANQANQANLAGNYELGAPGERVIGGSRHLAILKQLLATDRRLEGGCGGYVLLKVHEAIHPPLPLVHPELSFMQAAA